MSGSFENLNPPRQKTRSIDSKFEIKENPIHVLEDQTKHEEQTLRGAGQGEVKNYEHYYIHNFNTKFFMSTVTNSP